ncbi:MAG: UTP--glucose-1-phosphate uridylyltransferase [Candidatus Nealsonbacteria bacterium]|nr:UTP--glucose-1-phosphate uridylyltransferase [Candidatus Nealsonbacteria bacterium]
MAKKVKKAIIPAAGWGTRFLPATKAMPKEMLPIVDKPIIQYVVEETVAAGIKDIVIVTGWQKRAIEDHFDNSSELERHLRNKGKKKELAQIRKIAQLANFIYIRQKGKCYGNAIPVLTAKAVIDNEPFAVLWGDEFIMAQPPRLTQMLETYEKYKGAIISAVRIETKDQVSRYGIADIEPVQENVFKIKRIVEKPLPSQAPSNLAAHGAYILPPEIFDIIKKLKPGKDKEIWLVDAINELIKTGFPVYGCEIKNGKYYDTGNKLEYLKTVLEFSLQRPEFSKELKKYLRQK